MITWFTSDTHFGHANIFSIVVKISIQQLQLSARAYHRILKLARTIADLAEALQYRPKMDLM
ncbi:MAG: hypothetical protein HN413_17680 [Chloroflexi bacterium]|jgi:predicted ATPase with chaperone activity|nr:hypothetical protein [Chloroflexota bacterium]